MATTITRQSVSAINAEIKLAVTEILAAHGLALDLSKVSYSSTSAKFTITALVPEVNDAGVNLNTPEAHYWTTCGSIELEIANIDFEGSAADLLGVVFKHNGDEFRFVGFSSRRPKFPVTAERVSDGHKFKFSGTTLRTIISAATNNASL